MPANDTRLLGLRTGVFLAANTLSSNQMLTGMEKNETCRCMSRDLDENKICRLLAASVAMSYKVALAVWLRKIAE